MRQNKKRKRTLNRDRKMKRTKTQEIQTLHKQDQGGEIDKDRMMGCTINVPLFVAISSALVSVFMSSCFTLIW